MDESKIKRKNVYIDYFKAIHIYILKQKLKRSLYYFNIKKSHINYYD